MHTNDDIRLEAHGSGAVIQLRAVLSRDRVARAAALCDGLPSGVRRLRADLRAVHVFDPEAFAELAQALCNWRDRRRGMVTVDFPERRGAAVASRS